MYSSLHECMCSSGSNQRYIDVLKLAWTVADSILKLHIYTHIHICTNTHTHIYIHTHTHKHTIICMYIYIYIYIYTYTYVDKYTHTHIYIPTQKHTQPHTRTHNTNTHTVTLTAHTQYHADIIETGETLERVNTAAVSPTEPPRSVVTVVPGAGPGARSLVKCFGQPVISPDLTPTENRGGLVLLFMWFASCTSLREFIYTHALIYLCLYSWTRPFVTQQRDFCVSEFHSNWHWSTHIAIHTPVLL